METTPDKSNERIWVGIFCLAAAIKVLWFAAIFPFFNNVDEQAHFDLVVKYSRGQIPKSLNLFSPEAAQSIALFNSPEYFNRPDQFPNGRYPPPLSRLPRDIAEPVYEQKLARWQSTINHEASSPPLYYCAAGAWLALGRTAGLTGLSQLCWIRLMNVLVGAAVVWLGYLAARMVLVERRWLRLGVPLLLAVLPQDTFYSIQSDVFSPLCFGFAFVCWIHWLKSDVPQVGLGATTGLAIAASYLTKTSNIPLVCLSLPVMAHGLWRLKKSGRFWKGVPAVAAFVIAAGAPILLWVLWCHSHFGDLTGSAVKVKDLGWAHKPVMEWWPHPLFTVNGSYVFLTDLLASFWRGEFIWSTQRLSSAGMDAFYWASSTVFIGCALTGLFRKAQNAAPLTRQVLWLSFWSFVSAVAFLAFTSVSFDFGSCLYPSREYPYVTSGRLLTGALVPFALLYTYGLDRLLGWTKTEPPRLLALIGISVAIMISEILINADAIFSQYNWFNS